MAWVTIRKVRGVLTGIAKKSIIDKSGRERGGASAAVELMNAADEASATFEASAAELLSAQLD